MTKDYTGDEAVVAMTAAAIAAALDAGWSVEGVQDLVLYMWEDMIEHKAKFMMDMAIREAKDDLVKRL